MFIYLFIYLFFIYYLFIVYLFIYYYLLFIYLMFIYLFIYLYLCFSALSVDDMLTCIQEETGSVITK